MMYTQGCVARKTVFFFLLCWLVPLRLLADEANADGVMPECQVESDYLEQVGGLGHYLDRPESFSCFQTLDDSLPARTLIVDVRSSDAFRGARIPGSINLSANQLLKTQALKSRDVLVVDQGFARSRMAEFCAKAEAEGFDRLKILVGGTAAWSAADREMQGSPEEIHRLSEIEFTEFFVEAARQRVSVLVAEDQAESLQRTLGKQLSIQELASSEEDVEQQLISLLSSSQHDEIFPLVYVGSHPSVKAFARQNRSLFVLDQSMTELQRARHRLLAAASQRKAIPERYKCGG